MTGMQGRGGTPAGPPAGPPWSVDVLADLHAGVLDEAESASLWPLVTADPQAREVLAALDATLEDLHGIQDIPAPAMPPEFAARLDSALAAEAAQAAARPPAEQSAPAQVIELAKARRRRNNRLGWAGGVVAVAAAVAAVVLVVGQPRGAGGQPVAAAPSQSASSGPLDMSMALAAIGKSDYGPLADPARLSACLAVNGQDPDRKPAGAAQLTLNGKPGTLLVLTTGHTAQFRLLVVGPGCAVGNPDTLANAVVGGTPTS
jgi:hypothetical protein